MRTSVANPATLQSCPPPLGALLRARGGVAGALCALLLAAMINPAAAQRSVGIDVSMSQGTIDWTGVKNSGISFSWAKATEGVGYTDPSFTLNEAGAQAAGVLIGAYHFGRYDLNAGTSGAADEANYLWSVASNYMVAGGSYLMPMLDLENVPGGNPGTYGYTQATFSQWANAWCQTLSNNAAAAGVTIRPLIYASSSFANTWFDSTMTQWIPWIAEWHLVNPKPMPQSDAPASTVPWSTWTVWQYADNTPQPGITNNVTDGDIFNGDWTTLVRTLVIGGVTSLGPPVSAAAGFNFMNPGDTGSVGGPQGFPACETVGTNVVAGAVPQTGWYNLTQGGGPFTYHGGVGVGIYWSSYGGGTHNLPYGITPGDAILMRGYLDTGNTSTDYALVTSVPFPLYDVICYSKGDNETNTRVGQFTLTATNSGTRSFNQTKYIQDNGGSVFDGTYIEANSTNGWPNAAAGNYCRFYAVRGTNFLVSCTPNYGSDGNPRSPFNALQVVAVDPTPTLSNPGYANGQFHCFLNGATNASYVILASTNLLNWFPLSTNVAPGQITDAAGSASRFYRAVWR